MFSSWFKRRLEKKRMLDAIYAHWSYNVFVKTILQGFNWVDSLTLVFLRVYTAVAWLW